MIGKLKDFIIEALGGHTESEWQSTLMLYRQIPKEITPLDLVSVGASTQIDRWTWDDFDQESRKRFIKSQIKKALVTDLDQFIEYTVLAPQPPYDLVTIHAKMRVLRPEAGGVFTYD